MVAQESRDNTRWECGGYSEEASGIDGGVEAEVVEVKVEVEGRHTIISSWPELVITFAWNEDGGLAGKNSTKGRRDEV